MNNTNVAGLPMKSPIVIGSGPWSRGKENIKNALKSGAGAVITETIVSEPYPDTRPRYSYNRENRGVQNIRIYTPMDFETWIDDLTEICNENKYDSGALLIASIMGTTASELKYIAKKIEKTGVDAIEIGMACPMGEGVQLIASDPAMVYEFTEAVVSAVSIPVSVKLAANVGNLPEIVHAADRAGASGITAIDTLRGIIGINIETGVPLLPTYGGYSGAPIKPVGLAYVAGIVQSTNLPVIGIGGITNYKDMLEYLMLGASSCGVATQVLLSGYGIVGEILNDLNGWLNSHGYSCLDDIRGTSLNKLKSFEEIKLEQKVSHLKEPCTNEDCKRCTELCFKKAISWDGEVRIDTSVCTGCGICIGACPEEKIELNW